MEGGITVRAFRKLVKVRSSEANRAPFKLHVVKGRHNAQKKGGSKGVRCCGGERGVVWASQCAKDGRK